MEGTYTECFWVVGGGGGSGGPMGGGPPQHPEVQMREIGDSDDVSDRDSVLLSQIL